MNGTKSHDLATSTKPTEHAPKARSIERKVTEGEYWRYEGTEPFKDGVDEAYLEHGDVLLVNEIKIHEGEVHAVQFRVHPKRLSTGQSQHFTISAEEFFEEWTKADGRTVRTREKDAIKRLINDQENAIEQLARTTGTLQIAWKPEPGETGSTTIARTRERAKDLERVQAEMAMAAQRIGDGIRALGPYTEEEIEFVKSSHKGALREIEGAADAHKMLMLYIGDEVTIHRWNPKGRRAAPETPLKVYQRTRYIDEESLYRVLDGQGGADADDVQTYLRKLVTDAHTRERVVPDERCVVAMQPRRKEKRYKGPRLGDPLENKRAFLVVRNGEQIISVHWDAGEWPRLVPKRDTWKECFRENDRWSRNNEEKEPQWIGPDDVRFVDTFKHAQKTMRSYLSAWVVLAGAHLREQIFAPLEAETTLRRPLNLMLPQDHDQIVELIRDEEDALRISHEKWDNERAKTNAKVRVGGRVVVHTARAINKEQKNWYRKSFGSGIFDRNDQPLARPKSRLPIILRVRRRNGKLVVACPTTGGGTRDITLFEKADWWLWLEDANPRMLEIHLEQGREDYEEMAPLVIPALRALRGDAEKDKDLEPDEKAGAKTLRGIDEDNRVGSEKHQKIGKIIKNEEEWRKWAKETFGDDRWVEIGCTKQTTIIASVLPDALDKRSEAGGVLWADRYEVSTNKDGRPYKTKDKGKGCWGGEKVLWTNPEISETFRNRTDGRRRRLTYAQAQRMHKEVKEAAIHAETWFGSLKRSQAHRRAYVKNILEEIERTRNDDRRTQDIVLIPIAVVKQRNPEIGSQGAAMLCLRMSAARIISHWGGREGLDEAAKIAREQNRYYLALDYVKKSGNEGEDTSPGNWVIINDPKKIETGHPWAPTHVKWNEGPWWEPVCERERLRIDNDLELRCTVKQPIFRRAKRSYPTGWIVVERRSTKGMGEIPWIDSSDESDKTSNKDARSGRWD